MQDVEPEVKQSTSHIAIDVKHPQDAPPPFTPYEAESFETSDGDIISHDHHLNEDGEALYRFLLAQAAKPPVYIVTIKGTHIERRTRTVTTRVNGTTQTRTEHYNVTVVDFEFSIDLTRYIVSGPTHVSWPDDTPAYRGLMVRQIVTPQGVRRKATSDETAAFKTDEYAHLEAGLPPWQALDGSVRSKDQASSKNLREWADEYAASRKKLKELVYEKQVYGWSTSKLRSAISAAVASTSYSGDTTATFALSSTKICIRPDNALSRTLSKTLYKVLLWIFLIYPFIWLFKRFSRFGGGRWEVYSGMYALKTLEPLGQNEDLSRLISGEDATRATFEPRLVQGDDGGLNKLVGYREGEWFREWEEVIKRCAGQRVRRDEPFVHVQEGPDVQRNDAAENLEGY